MKYFFLLFCLIPILLYSANGELIALYTFDDADNPGADSSGQGNDISGTVGTARHGHLTLVSVDQEPTILQGEPSRFQLTLMRL